MTFAGKAAIRERSVPSSFISTVPVLQHTMINLRIEPSPKSSPIETPRAIDLHRISWTSRRRLGHHLLLSRGRPRRHERNFGGRLERSTVWWSWQWRLQRPIAALHILELPYLPAVFVPRLALASFAEEEI